MQENSKLMQEGEKRMQKNLTYIEKLPTADLYDFERLGQIPAIYFILDQYKNCLYIGQTKNLAIRFNNYQHGDRKKWELFKQFGATQIAWIHYYKTDLLYQHEQEWIQQINPPINDERAANYGPRCGRKKTNPILDHDLLIEFAELRLDIRNARQKIAQKQKEVVALIEHQLGLLLLKISTSGNILELSLIGNKN